MALQKLKKKIEQKKGRMCCFEGTLRKKSNRFVRLLITYKIDLVYCKA